MDLMNSISSTAMDMNAARFSVEYSMAVAEKVMDTQELAGQELVNMLSAAAPAPVKGEYIDTYA